MKNVFRRNYYWIYGKTTMGKPVVMGPYGDQLKADMLAEKLEDSRVFPLKTRNLQQATRTIKATLVQDSGSVDEHIRPHQHSMEGDKGISKGAFPFEKSNSSLASEILESSD